MAKVPCRLLEPTKIPRGVTRLTEEALTHVVVDAVNGETTRIKKRDSLGADQSGSSQ